MYIVTLCAGEVEGDSSEGEEEEGESDGMSEEESAEGEEGVDPTSQPKKVRQNIKKGGKKIKSVLKAAKLPRPNKKKTLTKGPKQKELKPRPAQEVERTHDETKNGREGEREDEIGEGKHEREGEETEQEPADDQSASEDEDENGRVRVSASHLAQGATSGMVATTRALQEPSDGGDDGGDDGGGSIDAGDDDGDSGNDEGGKNGNPKAVAEDKAGPESALRPMSNASPR